MTSTPLFSSLPSSVFIRSESAKLECEQHEGRSCCSMHALSWPGDRSLRKVAGFVRPRPHGLKVPLAPSPRWSAGVHGGDSGHERAVLLHSGWLYLLAISC